MKPATTLSLKPASLPSGSPATLSPAASFLRMQWWSDSQRSENPTPLPGSFRQLLSDPRFCRKLEGAARGSPGRRGYYSLDAEMVELMLKEGKL